MVRTTLGIFHGWGNRCSDMQRPALKLIVDTLRLLFHLQETMTRKTWSITFVIVQYFDLCFGIVLRSVVLVLYFWFTLYSHKPIIRYDGLSLYLLATPRFFSRRLFNLVRKNLFSYNCFSNLIFVLRRHFPF